MADVGLDEIIKEVDQDNVRTYMSYVDQDVNFHFIIDLDGAPSLMLIFINHQHQSSGWPHRLWRVRGHDEEGHHRPRQAHHEAHLRRQRPPWRRLAAAAAAATSDGLPAAQVLIISIHPSLILMPASQHACWFKLISKEKLTD